MQMFEFEEATHTYRLDGNILKGTTSTIKRFIQPFNADYHAKRMFAKYAKLYEGWAYGPFNYSVESIIDSWMQISKIASIRGTYIHKYIEHKIQGLSITDSCEYVTQDQIDAVDRYLTYDFYGSVVGCEYMVTDGEYAGTIDLVFKYNGGYGIRDWKTNKKFRRRHPYGEMMLCPLERLPATEYYIYALQLNMYRRLISNQYDINKLEVVWFDHEGNYKVIDIPIVPEYVDIMLKAS